MMEISETLHFHNEPGAPRVRIGVRQFMCVGALPPHDHPHVFINMGDKDEAICPYCATLFVYDSRLGAACDPPECAYLEPEDHLESALTMAVANVTAPESGHAAPSPAKAPATGGVIGAFATESALDAALKQLGSLGVELQTFTPKIIEDEDASSPLPWAIFIAGLGGAAAGFSMQAYANVVAYPLDIGGRPKFSWPAFVPIAFEIGVLLAVVVAIVGAFVAAGLFAYYDPVDDCMAMSRAMRDRFVVAARTDDRHLRARARDLLETLGANYIEEIAS